ncbi:hypothetical protein KAR91_78480 [Candidatus Pacearchaeota archaeon]|nr:hypothetical protein [Candidatus Pacearchaeota archaeon]
MADAITQDNLVRGIKKIIDKFGKPGYILKRKTDQGSWVDPARPSKGRNQGEEEFIFNRAAQSTFNQAFIDGETIKIEDLKLYVNPGDIDPTTVPQESDKITFGTKIWKVINVDTYRFGEIDILYIIQMRK